MVVVGFKHKGNPRYSLLFILFKNILLDILAIHFFPPLLLQKHGIRKLKFQLHLVKIFMIYIYLQNGYMKLGSVQFSSVQSLSRVRLFVTPWVVACQASLSITNSRSLLKLMPIESVMPSRHLILCCPLLLLPPIPPSIKAFSSESTLHIRWPKYWSFSFSISPSHEHPGLISFRMDWFNLLAVQGTLKSFLQHHSSKASIFQHSAFFTWIEECKWNYILEKNLELIKLQRKYLVQERVHVSTELEVIENSVFISILPIVKTAHGILYIDFGSFCTPSLANTVIWN